MNFIMYLRRKSIKFREINVKSVMDQNVAMHRKSQKYLYAAQHVNKMVRKIICTMLWNYCDDMAFTTELAKHLYTRFCIKIHEHSTIIFFSWRILDTLMHRITIESKIG